MKQGTILYKMTGSGNDFVFLDGRTTPVASVSGEEIMLLCARRSGIGADGLVVLEPGTSPGVVRFHFFNSDGRRASMCGNAALCATRLAARLGMAPAAGMRLETDAGTLASCCVPGPDERAEIEVPPHGRIVGPEIALHPGERSLHLTAVGVPHLVVLVDDVQAVEVRERGRELRLHGVVQPDGANVNFVSCREAEWRMRTFERGVEDETLACGTGAVAAAAVLEPQGTIQLPWSVRTASGSTLTVSGDLRSGARLGGEGRFLFKAVLGW